VGGEWTGFEGVLNPKNQQKNFLQFKKSSKHKQLRKQGNFTTPKKGDTPHNSLFLNYLSLI